MKGKGRVKTYILRTKKRGRTRIQRGRESTIIRIDTANQLRAQFAAQPGSSGSIQQFGNTNSKIDLFLDDSDEDVSQMIDMSFDRDEMIQTLNQSINTVRGAEDGIGNNLETMQASQQNLLDLNESDRSIVSF